MVSATLSSKFQLVIPKPIREQLGLRAGTRFAMMTKGDVSELVPLQSIREARGLLKGVKPT